MSRDWTGNWTEQHRLRDCKQQTDTINWLTDWFIHYSDATNVHPLWIEQIKSKTPQ